MTTFEEADFREPTLYDGFVNAYTKDFDAIVAEEPIIETVGQKDSKVVSFRFVDDPEGERKLNIFGIDWDKDNKGYNTKGGFGAFLKTINESGKTVGLRALVAKKMKPDTNADDPAYDYAFRGSIPFTGKRLFFHLEVTKSTKKGHDEATEYQNWTVTKITGDGAPGASVPAVANTNDAIIEKWRQLICDPEKVKLLGLPGSVKNIILNLKKVVPDVKECEAMQNVRAIAIAQLTDEGLLTIEGTTIKPV